MLFGFDLGVMGKAAAASYHALARIFYSSEMYTDSSMTNYLKNTGYTTQRENALAYASNHIYHDGVTHSTPCGIVHTLGSELVTNGTFDTDTSWTKDATVTISGGNAVFTSSPTATNGLFQVVGLIVGEVYKIAFDIVEYTSGDITMWFGGSQNYLTNQAFSSIGTHSLEMYAPIGSDGRITFGAQSSACTLKIDNVTVKQITLPAASYFHYYDTASKSIKQLSSTGDVGDELVTNGTFDTDTDWVKEAGWSISGGVALHTGTTSENISQVSLEAGKRYKISWYQSSIGISVYGGTLANLVANEITAGTFSSYFTADGTTLYFRSNVDGAYIDNVSVVESEPISTHYNLSSSYQYAISSTAPLTAADTAYIDANPEAMYRVLYDSLVLPSGFSSTDITHFYDGTGGVVGNKYVQDIATLGANTLTSYTSMDNQDEIASVTATSASGFTLEVTTAGTQVHHPRINYAWTDDVNSGKYYLFEFDINVISGIAVINALVLGYGAGYLLLNETMSSGRYAYIVKAIPSATYPWPSIWFDGTNIFKVTVSNMTLKEASVSEIANYTSNVRTNFLNTTYGATNLKLVKDASGRTTGVATAAQTYWDSDSRQAVTNWTITAPFTVTEECDGVTYTFTSDGNRYADGVADGTYTLPTGTWTLDDTAFDNVTSVSVRGNAQMITEVVIP